VRLVQSPKSKERGFPAAAQYDATRMICGKTNPTASVDRSRSGARSALFVSQLEVHIRRADDKCVFVKDCTDGSEAKTRRLDNLGFTWGVLSSSWEAMFEQLQQQWNSRVPISSRILTKLRRWMLHNGQFKKRGLRGPDREKNCLALDLSGSFCARWHSMFRSAGEVSFRARSL